MVDDTIRPVVGIYKNIRIDFCMGPDPDLGPTGNNEFEPRWAARRRPDRRPPPGDRLRALEAAAQAFEALRPADSHSIEHFKILVRPDLTGDTLSPRRTCPLTGGQCDEADRSLCASPG